MANATDVWVTSLQGTDPQNLMPYMTRQHIYDCRFWKEECFGLTVTTVLSKAATVLQCVGGTFGPNQQPTKFICLVLKLLQLQPDYDLIVEGFLHQDEFKYVRALGCFFLRLMTVARPYQVFQELEPLYRDYRVLRMRLSTSWTTIHMDEFIHTLVTQETCCGLAIPRLPLRHVLVQQGYLEDNIRRSALQDVVMEFQNQTKMKGGDNNKGAADDEDDDDNQLIDEEGLMAYLKHKADQQQCVAAQVLLQARLHKKSLLLMDQQEEFVTVGKMGREDKDVEDRHYSRDNDDRDNYRPTHNDHATEKERPSHLNKEDKEGQDQHRPTKSVVKSSSSSLSSKQHHDPSKRKYDNLFKKPKNKSNSTTSKPAPQNDDPAVDPIDSEAYWNEERVKLGLKPLKK